MLCSCFHAPVSSMGQALNANKNPAPDAQLIQCAFLSTKK
ncbi:hypothetical protein BMETH_875_0 [methanotrophic bacterial endosymbiont of Bathymodiolus sp.]|nr:hypothetical protein BMETH_875_0 [methanotrophic bacterial endosymbiont of Bathymodiolus sp.]